MAEVRGLEQKMWDHWKNHELDAMRDLMASDALFVGAQGTSTREQEIEEMKKSSCDVKSVSLQDVHVALASPTVVVITYRSKSEGSCDGKPFPKTGGVNSSVWSRKGGRWLTVLHQQSPATD